jgi:hypothetical protein
MGDYLAPDSATRDSHTYAQQEKYNKRGNVTADRTSLNPHMFLHSFIRTHILIHHRQYLTRPLSLENLRLLSQSRVCSTHAPC